MDELPKDSSQVDISTIFNGSKSLNEPLRNASTTNMVTFEDLSELMGEKEEFYLITADWKSTFLKLENFLEMGNQIFNKQSDLSIRNERSLLLNPLNKENVMRSESHTFIQWCHSIEPNLNRWNNTENKITIEEKVLFIVNNVGHIQRFMQLTLEYSKKSNISKLPLHEIIRLFMDIDEHHRNGGRIRLRHKKPLIMVLRGVVFSHKSITRPKKI